MNRGIEQYFFGGTNHDLSADNSEHSANYKLGEDIIFNLKINQGYTVKWLLFKDDAALNLYKQEQAVTEKVWYGTNTTRILNDTCDYSYQNNEFVLTTRRATPGTVRLHIQVFGENLTKPEREISLTAIVDAENIVQSLEKRFPKELLTAQTKKYFDKWKNEWDANITELSSAISADNSFKAWLKNPEGSYTVGNALRLKLVRRTDTYTMYHFWIATDSSKGITTLKENGLFDLEYNSRPATGVFAVPNNAKENSLGIFAQYHGYGLVSADITEPKTDCITVRMNSHGMDNDITEADRQRLGKIIPSCGGIDAFADMQNKSTPEEFYYYGILRRDYTALQAAKVIFDCYDNSGDNITTEGGSMGGWQATSMAALDSNVNEVSNRITWLCQIGAVNYGNLYSWHPNFTEPGGKPDAVSVFSSVTAAHIINERVLDNPDKKFVFNIPVAGLSDYEASAPGGVMALYNAFCAPNITKSINFLQFHYHSENFQGDNTKFISQFSNI